MRKKVTLAPLCGPTPERLLNAAMEVEVIGNQGTASVSRHRVKPVLTPFAIRQSILAENADKPEETRQRSLRRKLTPLDRALSDAEAASLERLTSCMNGLNNVGCVNYFQAHVKSDPFSRLPFSERKRREIGALAFINARLPPSGRILADDLAGKLDACAAPTSGIPSQDWLDDIQSLAATVATLYRTFDRSYRHPDENGLAACE